MGFLKKLVKGVLGMDDSAEKAAREAARRAEEQMRKMQEAQKLQAMNEMQSVTTIGEDTSLTGVFSGDTRRRKRSTGAATSNLGLNV